MAQPVYEVGGIVDSSGIGGGATAPGAGSTFVGLPASQIPAGIYRIRIGYILTGTTETALTNVRVAANGANYLTPLPSLSGSGWTYIDIDRLTLNGVNQVNLVAIAAATGGAVYSGFIVATRIG